MPENNQDQTETAIPGASIKDSAIESHIRAVDQIREKMKTMKPTGKALANAVIEAERHETAAQILFRDENLSPDTTSTIPKTSHGLTPHEALEENWKTPTILRKKQQEEIKKLNEALDGPSVTMKDAKGNDMQVRTGDVRGGTKSDRNVINWANPENGEPTEEWDINKHAGEINNN